MKSLNLSRLLASLLVAISLIAPVASSYAVTPDEMLDDPVLEQRARDISTGLRCLVCQNQSIDDSDAPLAHDLRVLVRERLEAGDSDGEVKDFLVSRYGEFVLLKPTFSAKNLILWLFGPLVLLLGVIVVLRLYRKNKLAAARAKRAGSDSLSEEEQARLKKILFEESNN
ncbi:cytochrome c-type biogenesis protein [uncultured Cohaesibacter sp.]|uniref:cytochrome c-type biogenesis protein n=1 Tax=uncultured Cohaesibacter sp. TaxID=1002546 RepID=UPI0029C7DCB0|nr:cytochrome c-type biogenesis protein [uncultured Cohaesibacter sp.]